MRQRKKNLYFIAVLFLFLILYPYIITIDVFSGDNRKPSLPSPPLFIEGEVLVKFKEGSSSQKRGISSLSSSSIHSNSRFNIVSEKRTGRYVLLKSDLPTDAMIEKLKTDPSVEAVSPNYIVSIHSKFPNDSKFNSLWGMNNHGEAIEGIPGIDDADIDAPEAWEIGTGFSDVVVAVIDTGVDYTHEDLRENIWINKNEIPDDDIDNDNNGFTDDIYGVDVIDNDSDPMDNIGHGTHVAGIIAASGDNSKGVTGVNWRAKIMAVKIFDYSGFATNADAIEAVEYVVNMKKNYGVNITAINASWGGSGFSQFLKDAIDDAGREGIIFVASAGNSGNNLDYDPMYPASFTSSNIISVTASDHKDDLSYFSNYGEDSVDIAAPGEEILSTLPGGGYTPGASGIFFDAVETGSSKWSQSGKGWEISGNNHYSGTSSWKGSDTSALETKGDINLSGYIEEDIRVGLWAHIENLTYSNSLSVDFSGDGGATWHTEGYISKKMYQYNSDNVWNLYTVFIPEKYRTEWFRFRFRLYYSAIIYIDDIGLGVGTGSDKYGVLSGTSMAAPHVTGAVALSASLYPDEDINSRINHILMADILFSLTGKTKTGGRENLASSISPSPFMELSANQVDFGSVYLKDKNTKGITVSNKGRGELFLDNISIKGLSVSEFTVENNRCRDIPVSSLMNCVVDISFTPTSAGDKSAELVLNYNSPSQTPVTILVSGYGDVKAVSASEPAAKNEDNSYGLCFISAVNRF